jgi:hypothetical protein
MGYHCFISDCISCQYPDDAELLASAKSLSMGCYPALAASTAFDMVGLYVCKKVKNLNTEAQRYRVTRSFGFQF